MILAYICPIVFLSVCGTRAMTVSGQSRIWRGPEWSSDAIPEKFRQNPKLDKVHGFTEEFPDDSPMWDQGTGSILSGPSAELLDLSYHDFPGSHGVCSSEHWEHYNSPHGPPWEDPSPRAYLANDQRTYFPVQDGQVYAESIDPSHPDFTGSQGVYPSEHWEGPSPRDCPTTAQKSSFAMYDGQVHSGEVIHPVTQGSFPITNQRWASTAFPLIHNPVGLLHYDDGVPPSLESIHWLQDESSFQITADEIFRQKLASLLGYPPEGDSRAQPLQTTSVEHVPQKSGKSLDQYHASSFQADRYQLDTSIAQPRADTPQNPSSGALDSALERSFGWKDVDSTIGSSPKLVIDYKANRQATLLKFLKQRRKRMKKTSPIVDPIELEHKLIILD